MLHGEDTQLPARPDDALRQAEGVERGVEQAAEPARSAGLAPLLCHVWKSHATLTLLATQDLPTFGYNMIDPLKSWCWGSILFYPFKISRFS